MLNVIHIHFPGSNSARNDDQHIHVMGPEITPGIAQELKTFIDTLMKEDTELTYLEIGLQVSKYLETRGYYKPRFPNIIYITTEV